MKASVFVLLLILASRVGAQTEQDAYSVIPRDQSHLLRPGDTVSLRDLRIPLKAIKELQRSQSALRSGDTRASARHLERALQIYPDYLEGHNSLGARYFDLREYDKVALEFEKAIDIDPHVVQPVNNLSVAFFLLERYSEAEVAARHAINLDPSGLTPRYMLGCILAAEKRNPVEAMKMLRQTKLQFPDAHLLLARILLWRGAVDETEQELREYLAVPGAPKKQIAERWLAKLKQKSATNSSAQLGKP
jgi:tetratricopeptide (TPR) repeat protein